MSDKSNQIEPPPDNVLLYSKWAIIDPDFDVQSVKKNFYNLMNKQTIDGHSRIFHISRERYDEIVKKLEIFENPSKEGRRRSNTLDHYQLHNDCSGKPYISRRNNSSGSPILKILPLEDIFDVLTDIHLDNSHCRLTKMKQLLKKRKYDISPKYMSYLIGSCNICQKSVTDLKTVTSAQNYLENKKYIVEIYPMYPCTDGDFQFIFYCRDTDTQYVFLRPLIAKCSEEVATEILKIVTCFGSPTFTLKSSAQNFEFFKNTTSFFTRFGFRFTTCMETHTDSDAKSSDIRIIQRYLQNWMQETGSTNWGLGCHIVQYKMNNKLTDTENNGKQSAYLRVFKHAPITHTLDNTGSNDTDNEEYEVMKDLDESGVQLGSKESMKYTLDDINVYLRKK